MAKVYYPPSDEGSKRCTKCGEIKPRTVFSPALGMKDGRASWCRSCVSSHVKTYYGQKKDDPEWRERRRQTGAASGRRRRAARPDMERTRYLKSKYGLTREVYDAMLQEQGGVCAVDGCLRPATDVDHDHSCCPGKKSCGSCVRRLLCNPCNVALGLVGDDVELLRGMIVYIESLRLKDVMTN